MTDSEFEEIRERRNQRARLSGGEGRPQTALETDLDTLLAELLEMRRIKFAIGQIPHDECLKPVAQLLDQVCEANGLDWSWSSHDSHFTLRTWEKEPPDK